MPKRRSDSPEQREAELALIAALARDLGRPLIPAAIALERGVVAHVDGVNEEARILCEAYAHIGRPKGSQPAKLAKDILKLLLVEKIRGGEWRKIICLADQSAASCLVGRSWLAMAVRTFGIEIRVFVLPPDLHQRVEEAQVRQVMVNPP